jgi:hypothetical protein
MGNIEGCEKCTQILALPVGTDLVSAWIILYP